MDAEKFSAAVKAPISRDAQAQNRRKYQTAAKDQRIGGEPKKRQQNKHHAAAIFGTLAASPRTGKHQPAGKARGGTAGKIKQADHEQRRISMRSLENKIYAVRGAGEHLRQQRTAEQDPRPDISPSQLILPYP